jgi:hypothetical protein
MMQGMRCDTDHISVLLYLLYVFNYSSSGRCYRLTLGHTHSTIQCAPGDETNNSFPSGTKFRDT